MIKSVSNRQPLQQSRLYNIYIIFFLYNIGDFLSTVVLRTNIPQIACLNLFQQNLDICSHLEKSYDQHQLDKVQKQAAKYMIYVMCLTQVPSIVLLLYWGAWSDRNGRKVPMLLPPIGMILGTILYMTGNFLPRYSFICLILGSGIDGIAGRISLLILALFCYVTDTSDYSERKVRFGMLMACQNFGKFAGSLIAGVLIETTHIAVPYGTNIFVCILVVIAIHFLKENRSVETDNGSVSKQTSTGLKHLKDSTVVLLKRRRFSLRGHLCVMTLVLLLNIMCVYGTLDSLVLYTELPPLSWPPSWFGYLIAYDSAVKGVINMIFIPILSKTLNVPELIISAIGALFTLFHFLLITWSKQTWMIYLAITIGGLRTVIIAPIRSVVSKCVGEDEIGKIFAVIGSGDTLAKIFGLIFPALYSITLDVSPGGSFLLGSGIYAIMAILLLHVHFNLKDYLSHSEECENFLEEMSDSDESTNPNSREDSC